MISSSSSRKFCYSSNDIRISLIEGCLSHERTLESPKTPKSSQKGRAVICPNRCRPPYCRHKLAPRRYLWSPAKQPAPGIDTDMVTTSADIIGIVPP
ncbi:hypothetical protein JCGZ_22298 [Jatropha curcas]|uniref:Uncharacterized protein n=1 Tax=Jatropha curcas TaxID=180498 RepID=A0A067JU58_JATCU|nr:hypothetical protein JCGZ_22298 [Jatropha curcas]